VSTSNKVEKLEQEEGRVEPGVCIPWEEKVKEYEHIENEEVVRKAWEELDRLAYRYIWHWLIA
jgi:hypothetical protein